MLPAVLILINTNDAILITRHGIELEDPEIGCTLIAGSFGPTPT